MAGVRVSTRAQTDLDDIGRRRDDDLRPGLRSFPVSEYVILYRIGGEEVVILYVTRGSRDLDRLVN